MTDEIESEEIFDDGPSLEDAKVAAEAPPEPVEGADDLPTDVKTDSTDTEETD